MWLGVGAQKTCQVKEGMEELSPGPLPPLSPSPHCLVTPSFSTILTSPSSPGSWRDSWSSWISSSPTWLVLLPCSWELNMAHSPNGDSSDPAWGRGLGGGGWGRSWGPHLPLSQRGECCPLVASASLLRIRFPCTGSRGPARGLAGPRPLQVGDFLGKKETCLAHSHFITPGSGPLKS